MNLNKAIKELKFQTIGMNQKYRPYADQVLNLFKDRKIEKRKEAEKLLDQLASRGKAPQAAITKINEKYSKAESATGKLDRRELKDYFVSGIINSVHTYKQQLKKTGTIRERNYNIQTPYALPVRATSKAGAEIKFVAAASSSATQTGEDSNIAKTRKFQSASINSIVPASSFTAASDGAQLMKAAQPVEYSFIPTDHSLIKTPGFCVLDQFLGIYSPLIKHLTHDYFINSCFEVRGEVRPAKKEISALDRGIQGIEDDPARPGQLKTVYRLTC